MLRSLTRVAPRLAQLRSPQLLAGPSLSAPRPALAAAPGCAHLLNLPLLSSPVWQTRSLATTAAMSGDADPAPTRFAIVELAGSQYKVANDDLICVEKMPMPVGTSIDARRVLLVGEAGATIIGSPLIAGASVRMTVEEQGLGKKIVVFKKRRRKGYRRWKGHRSRLTVLRVGEIALPEAMEAQLEQDG